MNIKLNKNLSYYNKNKFSAGQLFLHIFFICLCVLFIYPVILTISISFSDEAAIANNGYALIPEKWSIEGYKYALQNSRIGHAYLVTIMASMVGTTLSVLVMMLYAYPLSRKDYKPRLFWSLFGAIPHFV